MKKKKSGGAIDLEAENIPAGAAAAAVVVFAGSVAAGVVDVAAGAASVGLLSAFLPSFLPSFFPLRAAFNFSHRFLRALGAVVMMRLENQQLGLVHLVLLGPGEKGRGCGVVGSSNVDSLAAQGAAW